MKRAVVIFCFMLVVLNLVAQTALPDTILIRFYQGGDWREKGVSGSFDEIDSITYVRDEENDFVASKMIHIFETHPFDDGFQPNSNPYSRFENHYFYYIQEKDVQKFLTLLDTNNYSTYLVKDTVYEVIADTNSGGYVSDTEHYTIDVDELLVPNDFSSHYYDIDIAYFACFCEYYKGIFRQKYPDANPLRTCQHPNIEYLMGNLVRTYKTRVRNVSSYMANVQVKIKFKSKTLTLYQSSPCNDNIQWLIFYNEEDYTVVLNPKINDMIMEILPTHFSTKDCLLDYKDKEELFHEYLFR